MRSLAQGFRAGPVLVVLAGLGACAGACPPGSPDAGDDGGPGPEDAGPPDDGVHDALARPTSPTLSLSNFSPVESCARCHATHAKEWATSMHSYAMVDPVFRAIVHVRQEDFGGEQDQFCVSCHSSIGTRSFDITEGFAFDNLSTITLDGVTCEACHKAEAVARPFNSGLVLDEFAPMYGPIMDPQPSTFHAAQGTDLLGQPQFCGACHDVYELNGLNLERPYAEFLESPRFEEGGSCQECHMPTYEGLAADGAQAPAGGQTRTLHSHRFVGVDVPLSPDFLSPEDRAAVRADVQQLLEGCGTLTVSAGPAVPGTQVDLFVSVKNEIDAHNLPTGSTFVRQMWIEITVTDDEGNVLYETGDLDANGDLRDAFSELDPYGDGDLLKLSSILVDENGSPEIFTWRAREHFSNSLSPLYERTWTLFVPTEATTPFPLHAEARLRFRSHGPFLLRALSLDELVDQLEIFDIDEQSLTIDAEAAK